ncbi:hypothetical protein D018_0923A, partial [Vibrio parahaemolyticus VP2007-007]|jgi:hypothetical protein
MPQR